MEYCRGLIIRVKTRGVSYLRLAHMTAQEYFLQVEFLQQYHSDICLTCFNHVISCLPPERLNSRECDGYVNQKGGIQHEDDHDSDDVTSEYTLNSSANEVLEEPAFSGSEDEEDIKFDEGDNEENDDDGIGVSLVDEVDSRIIFEDHQSWRFNQDV